MPDGSKHPSGQCRNEQSIREIGKPLLHLGQKIAAPARLLPQAAQKQEQPAAPTPVERADLQRALDQLDEQDGYLLDRPRGRINGPIKDW